MTLSYTIPRRRPVTKSGIERVPQRVFPQHRAWIRRHMCAIPGCTGEPIEVAHLRTAANSGVGLKPRDDATVPLCRDHYRRAHTIGHDAMARENGTTLEALFKIAAWLASRSPDRKLREAMAASLRPGETAPTEIAQPATTRRGEPLLGEHSDG